MSNPIQAPDGGQGRPAVGAGTCTARSPGSDPNRAIDVVVIMQE